MIDNSMQNFSGFGKPVIGPFALVLALVLGCAAGVAAFAPEAWAKNPDRAVSNRDKDGDGRVSPAEWEKSREIFDRIDKNGDGFLTPDDFAQHWQMIGGGSQNGGPKNGASSGGQKSDKTKEAQALLKSAFKELKKGRNQKALEITRKAAELIKGADAPKKLYAKVHYFLAKREFGAGNTLAALRASKIATATYPGPLNVSDLVKYYTEAGRLPAAEDAADKARGLAEEALAREGVSDKKRFTVVYGISMMNATLHQKQGRWREAESEIRTAIGAGKELKSADPDLWVPGINAYRTLAFNLIRQGRAVEAEIAAREGLNLARSKAGKAGTHLGNLARAVGEALLAQGRREDAQTLAAEAVDHLTGAGEPPSSRKVVLAKRFAATLLALGGEWQAADDRFTQLRADLAGNEALTRRLLDNNQLVTVAAIKQGKAKDVRSRLEAQHTRVLDRNGETHKKTIRLKALLAMALAAMGDQDLALKFFTAAVPKMLSSSNLSESDEDDSQSVSTTIRRAVFESYMALLSDLRNSETAADAGIDPVAEAFRVADAARGSIVQKALVASGARAVVGDKELAKLVRTEQDTRKSVGALNQLLAQILGRPEADRDGQAVKELEGEIERTRTGRDAAMNEIESRFPEYARLINPRPATIDEARAALAPGEALITTYIGDARGFAWAVDADGARAFTAIDLGAEDVDDMVATLRSALDPGPGGLADIADFDVGTAYELYARVLKPLEAVWKKARNLVVVAHGPLGALPFSVLPTTAAPLPAAKGLPLSNHKAVAWLAKTHSVTLVPSVAALASLRRLPPAAKGRVPFIGFGDPYFNEKQTETATQVAQVSGTMRGVPVVLRSVLRGVENAELARLPRLPDTATEVFSIAKALATDPAKSVFLGADASEARVKSMDLSGYKIVTFATHGLVPGDLKGLVQPALAMSTPKITGGKGDGLLTMEEILNLKLDADWVVLSACNTASGAGAGAEAVSGLGQAFFYAGTRSLLASNWPVETTSAKALTTDIFRRQAGDSSLKRAEALRRAMMGLMETGVFRDPKSGKPVFSFAHPIFWAPFSLIGDG